MFSLRTSWDRTENPLARALQAVRAAGEDLYDLTESNPTRANLLDQAPLIAPLGNPRGALYEPAPLGHPVAREAVARYYAERGVRIDPSQVVISASTSESYGWLLRLLADETEAVLVPQPSYPLFAWLGAAENVRLLPYRLHRDAAWSIDTAELERSIAARTRAILLVHPNNPTGAFTRRREAEELVAIAARRGLAIVVDEVFGDYALGKLPDDRLPTFAGTEGALTFVLSGLSKVLLLPQCKLAWTVVSGPPPLVEEALARLELVADTYLSAATPTQLALPELLAARPRVQAITVARLARNLSVLDEALVSLGPSAPVRRLPIDGGWYATLEVPRLHDEDGWVDLLVREAGVIVHPGHFFDFDRDGFLVLSLLTDEPIFREGIRRLMAAIGGRIE